MWLEGFVKRRRGWVEWGLPVCEGRRPEEVEYFAKICSSTSRLELCLDELWGGPTQQRKLLSFPVYFFSKKFMLRACQPCS